MTDEKPKEIRQRQPRASDAAPAIDPEEVSVLPYPHTWVLVFILLFFVMGGYLPTPSTRVSSLAATSSASDTIFGQLFQGVAWLLGCILMFPYAAKIFALCQQMKVLVAIPVLAVASVAWSQDPGGTIRKGVFLLLGTFFAFYLSRRYKVETLAQVIVLTGVVAGVLGILVSVALPSYGRDNFNGGAWQGIFRSKNGCAQIMLFFFTAAVCFRFEDPWMRRLRISLYPITALLVVMSKAATAFMLAPGLLAVVAFLTGLKHFERRNALVLMLAVLILMIGVGIAMPILMPMILAMLGKDPEMSGRLPLWAAVTASSLKRPMLGYGYAAFWTGMRGESLNVYMATHFEIYQAQNGILEVWVELGAVGVALVVATIFTAGKDLLLCLQCRPSPRTNWYFTLFALTIIYNIDETFMASAHSLPWLLYTIACIGFADMVKDIKRGAAPMPVPPARRDRRAA